MGRDAPTFSPKDPMFITSLKKKSRLYRLEVKQADRLPLSRVEPPGVSWPD